MDNTANTMAPTEPIREASEAKRALTLGRVALAMAASALVLTAALGIAGYVVLAGRLDHLDRQVSQAEEQGAQNSSRIADNESKISANADALEASGKAQVAGLKSQLVALTHRVNSLRDCLPELNNELNSLSVSTSDVNGYLTGAYLNNNLQISRVCQPVLSPSRGVPGE